MPKKKMDGPLRTRTNPATGKPMVGKGVGPNMQRPSSAESVGAPRNSIGGSAVPEPRRQVKSKNY